MAWIPWFAVAAFALLVAVGELVSRFRDAPGRLARTGPFWLYCMVNAGGALLTFAFIQAFGWTAGLPPTETNKILWTQVLASSFSALMLLRSSLFRVKVGGQDIEVGFGILLQQILGALDREIDRREGQRRLDSLDVFAGLKFAEIVDSAPAICAGVLRSLTDAEQSQLKKSIDAIAGGKGSEGDKLRLLALELLNVAGPEIVQAVAQKLKPPKTTSLGPVI